MTRLATAWPPALLVCAFLAFAPVQAAPERPRLTDAEAALLRQAAERGALMYAYDRAAWKATDDLREKLPDFGERVGGWIVDGPGDSPQLVFYDRNEADPVIVYRAEFSGMRLVSSRVLGQGDDRSLSPARKAMIAARRSAIDAVVAAKSGFCSEGMPNTVVLPPSVAGGPTLVYFLTPQTTLKSIPLGGHYLVEVSADGRAGKPRPFTKTCIEMPFGEEAYKQTAALVVTHLLDPVPTELHVFSSMAAGLPIFVSTRKGKRLRVWEAAGREIHLVSDEPAR